MEQHSKIALITGGSRGLGKNAVSHLANSGIDCILTYNSKREEAEAVVADVQQRGRKAVALQLDVAATASFDAFMQQVASVLRDTWQRDTFDVLVNNAGINAPSLIADTTEADLDWLFSVHFKGAYLLTQKSLPMLADNGRIINFSTGLARFTTPGYAAYASMKSAIETFTRYLAKELGPRGITANVVAPGPIETDFTREALDRNPNARAYIGSQTALGRVGVADDIGGIVAFLCSEQARWVNAQRIEASGGLYL